MKKTFLSLLLLVAATTMSAQSLVIWHVDGSTTEVELYNQPLVQFVGEKMIITSPVINMEYDKSDVLRFTYQNVGTGISTPKSEINFEQKGAQILFHNISSADNVAVYRTDGIRVPVQLSFQGGNAILSLSQISSGVYLLSVNGRTSKFTKK